jgi:AraC-like DNA-binding protein
MSDAAMRWSSESVSPREQFSSWREACCQRVYAVTPEREAEGPTFRGSIDARWIGELDVVGVRCEPHTVSRTQQDVRRAPSDTYYLYLQLGKAVWFSQRERLFNGGRGDIVLADPNVPFSTGAVGDFDFRLLRLPRTSVDRYLSRPGHLPMVHLAADSAECALLTSCLAGLWTHGDRLDARLVQPVTDALTRLMAMTAGIAPELQDAAHDAMRVAMLERAQQYIVTHYTDLFLSPAVAAKALGVSVRKLHLVLSASGKSFSERLADRRLDEARLRLSTPGISARPISEIAFDVGYADLSTFYRAFRAKWGVTPGELREAAAARGRVAKANSG